MQARLHDPLTCNFRPVPDRSCCPLAAFRPKGVHCMCMHATRAHIRRRCRVDAARRADSSVRHGAACAVDGRARTRRTAVSACAYLAVAVAIAMPSCPESDVEPASSSSASSLGYALSSRSASSSAGLSSSPEQLVVHTDAASRSSALRAGCCSQRPVSLPSFPTSSRDSWHRERWLDTIRGLLGGTSGRSSSSRPSRQARPDGAHLRSTLAAFAAHLAYRLRLDHAANRLLDRASTQEMACVASRAQHGRRDPLPARVRRVTLAAIDEPLVPGRVIAPLVWLLDNFSHDRGSRYAAALELQPRVSRHGDAPVRRARVRGRVHGAALPVRRRPRQCGRRRARRSRRTTGRSLEFAAMLHDVGKISIPKDILQQAGCADRHRVRGHQDPHDRRSVHARPGRRAARAGGRDRALLPRALGRHRLSRTALRARTSRIAARIVFCCDAYNAMTTDRAYREAMDREAAVAELDANTGAQFDPTIVAAVTKVVERGEPGAVTSHRGRPSRARRRAGATRERAASYAASVHGYPGPGTQSQTRAQGERRRHPHE